MTPRIHPALRALTLASACALLAAAPKADAANTRYAQDTIIVRLSFDGDPGFPSLTSFRDTSGLARFTGLAFGLTESQRNEVVQRIVDHLRDRYKDFNVEFISTFYGPAAHFTWGIDDTAYYAPRDGAPACTDTNQNVRVMGKAIGSIHPDGKD